MKEKLKKIESIKGDITDIEIDAIVNAVNNSLLGGGGVDGAIHRAAGSELVEECKKINEVKDEGRCPTGEARITKGYRLPAKYVIHTVGPIYDENSKEENEKLLTSCYENSLKLAVENNIKTIAFPAISCGIYGYPIKDACKIAVGTALKFIESNPSIEKVYFINYSDDNKEVYDDYIASLS